MKEKFFNPLQLKHLMGHKGGTYLQAIATDEGLCLLPQCGEKVWHLLRPLDVKVPEKTLYSIEDGYQIAKLADALDFTKAEYVSEDGLDYLVLGKKKFHLVQTSISEERYGFNLSGYQGKICLTGDDCHLIRAVSVAQSEEKERYFMNGVYLDGEGYAVATDGHRLASGQFVTLPAGLKECISCHPDFEKKQEVNDVLLPRWLIPFLEDKYAEISWAYYDKECGPDALGEKTIRHEEWNRWKLETDGEIYLFETLHIRFPKWRKVMPELSPAECNMDFEGLKRYKKSGKNDLMRVEFKGDNCYQMYQGEIELVLDVALPFLPENAVCMINVEYLQDGAKIFGKGNKVKLALPEPEQHDDIQAVTKALLFTDLSERLKYVVMPYNYC